MVEKELEELGRRTAEMLLGTLFCEGAELMELDSGNTRVIRAVSWIGYFMVSTALSRGHSKHTLSAFLPTTDSSACHCQDVSSPTRSLLLPAKRVLKSTLPVALFVSRCKSPLSKTPKYE
jgi:hypothetical protein